MAGIKHDSDKIRWELLPFDALESVAKIFTHGAKKYNDRNWEAGMNYSRLYGAAMRHLSSWFMKRNGGTDPEFGESHLAHAACCILFLLAYEQRGMIKWDDRPDAGAVAKDDDF